MSGKHTHLPRRLARDGREPAHIGETLLPMAEGNPEGSPSDPLTTDPKGEACHPPESPEIYVTRNTPALIAVRGANGDEVLVDQTVSRDKAVARNETPKGA